MSDTLYGNSGKDEQADPLYKCELCGIIWDGNVNCVCGMLGTELDDYEETNLCIDSSHQVAVTSRHSNVSDTFERHDVTYEEAFPLPPNIIHGDVDSLQEPYYREEIMTLADYNFNEDEMKLFTSRLEEGWSEEDAINEIRFIRVKCFANTFAH